MRILVIEDDAMLGDAMATGLRQNGWEAVCAADARAARVALVDHAYDAVLLDLSLPDGSGLAVLKTMRERYDGTPVLIVSARDKLSDRIAGLDIGADDYLTKPFELDELYARLRALLRRSQGRVAPVLTWGDVVLDPARRAVTRGGQAIALSVHEYATLLALMERRPRPVTREQLEAVIYGSDGTIESNTIAVYIHQLRRKLHETMIVTVHGYGYRIGEADA